MGTYTFPLAFLLFLVNLQYTAAIRCLSCNDVIQPRHCSRIEHCPDGDACVAESYQNKNGETLFNVGCMSVQRCSLTAHHNRSADLLRSDIMGTHVPDLCSECCHSDLCNAAGCGTEGYPKQRGPICLDCPQSHDPAFCDVISVCLQGEVCHVEEIYEFGDVFYKTSCVRNTDYQCAPPPVYNPVEVGRRSTRREPCFFCCPYDLCNTKCHISTSFVQTTTSSTTRVPMSHSNAVTSLAPSTVQTTQVPSTVQTTLTPSTVQTTLTPSTVQTTLTPSTVQTTLTPSTVQTTQVPSIVQTTLTPSTVQTTQAPSTVQTTLAPSIVQTTLAPSTVQTTLAPIRHSFKGKEFFLMFMKNLAYVQSDVKLHAIVTSLAPRAKIQVITRYNSTSKLVSGPVEHIDIDGNMTMRENGKTSKGIIVTSNTSMSVTAFNRMYCCSSEGYHPIPIKSLGVTYIVGTLRPTRGSTFAVGAPYDNTVVNITLSSSGVRISGQYYNEGETIIVVLDRLDTFYAETNDASQDLTGTRIVSDKPVAVVSGNICSAGSGCNHLVEYLPPVTKWGTGFMVPPVVNTKSGYVRIVSSVNNTDVVVSNINSNKTYTTSTYIDINTDPLTPYAISSDKPVLVLLICYQGSPGMTMVPSTDQFSRGSVLVSPPYEIPNLANYIVVSIRSSDQSGLQLRSVTGTDLPRIGSVDFPDADGEIYSFISVTCNNNQTCSVQHSDDNVTFSVISYGFRDSESYAYPANLSL